MIKQKKSGRGLLTVAFAAAPLSALAAPLPSAPTPHCISGGQLADISWQNGSSVGTSATVIDAVVTGGSGVTGGGGSKGEVIGVSEIDANDTASPLPFECNTSWNVTEVKADDFVVETKGTGATTGSNVFASAGITQGNSFSIDFGPFHPGLEMKDASDVTPTFTAFDYQTGSSDSGAGAGKVGGGPWVTDFNLLINDKSGAGPFQDYLGVQVISGASALAVKNGVFLNNGQLIFDPPISGLTQVNLLSSPDPHQVPEPATLALMMAGLTGLLAWVGIKRRRKTAGANATGPYDGEPEA